MVDFGQSDTTRTLLEFILCVLKVALVVSMNISDIDIRRGTSFLPDAAFAHTNSNPWDS